MKPEMVLKVDDYWLVNSATENNVQYKVEKTKYTSCIDCLIRCNLHNTCVHTYKCSCLDNII